MIYILQTTNYYLQAPIGESVIQRNLRIGKRHNRINERTRKPMNKYKEDKFDREIRWMFFLNLRHENEGTKDAVIQAVEPQLDPMSYQYEDLWKAIMGKVNHLRGGTVGYLKVLFASLRTYKASRDAARSRT